MEQGDPTATAEQVRAFEDLTRRWQRQLEDQMRFMKSGVEEVRAILTPEQMAQLEVPPIRPPIELIGLLDELRIRLTSGEFDGPGPHLVEFAGGVVRIENRLGHLDYDPMWIEEGRTMHVPRVVDLDFTDDITPDERSRDSDSN